MMMSSLSSEDSVTPRILAQIAYRRYIKEKLHEIVYYVSGFIFHSYKNERD